MLVAISMCVAGASLAKAAEPATSGEGKMDTAQPAIVRDAMDAAEWAAKWLSSNGYKGDFTIESLKDIDRFFDEQAPGGKPKPRGLLSHHFGMQMFALGAYVGETIRRQRDGEWRGNDNDPEAEITLAVRLKSGVIFWPTQPVLKRIMNGPEDAIYPYGVLILQDSDKGAPKDSD
jgi:hypothetical protein